MTRSRAYPHRWDGWLHGERVASGTAWNMAKAQSMAEAYFNTHRSSLLVLQITTPNGVVYFYTHPERRWLPQSSLKRP